MPGLLRGMARTAVIAGTATAVSNNVSRRQAERWYGEEAPAQAQAAPAPTAAASTDDQITQLQQLATLKEQGILTEAEFAAKKQQILGL